MKSAALFSALAFVALTGGASLAADQWKEKGKECDAGAFKDPASASMADLVKCSKLWIAYRSDLGGVKGDYKDRVVLAMKLLYAKGPEIDSGRAKDILANLGVSELPKRQGGGTATAGGDGTATAPQEEAGRKTFAPPAPDKGAIKKADGFLKAGYKVAAKDPAKALVQYLKAVDAAPGYPTGHYNAACIYAIQKDEKNMAKYLLNLRDLATAGNATAAEQLKKSRTDPDFDGMRDTSNEYKRITGYAKMRVINKLGEKGEENVDNLVSSMKKLGYVADSIEKDADKKQKAPILYYIEAARTQAYIVKQLIKHPGLEVQLAEKLCSAEDDKCFDVVVQWSDEVKGEPKKFVADPKDAEKEIAKLEKKQDEILAKPNEAVDELDEALGKPEEVQEKIDGVLKKPGKAIEKTEKTIEKIKGVF